LLAEGLHDLGLRFNVLLQVLAVPGFLERVAVVLVASDSLVTGDAGDARCRGAGSAAAVLAKSDSRAVQGGVATTIPTTGTKALTLCLVVALVLDVAGVDAGGDVDLLADTLAVPINMMYWVLN